MRRYKSKMYEEVPASMLPVNDMSNSKVPRSDEVYLKPLKEFALSSLEETKRDLRALDELEIVLYFLLSIRQFSLPNTCYFSKNFSIYS